jgi:hypothetical protein
MDASLPKQVNSAAPVWEWMAIGGLASLLTSDSPQFIIVRLENGVTLPVNRTRLQPRDPMRRVDDRPRRPYE